VAHIRYLRGGKIREVGESPVSPVRTYQKSTHLLGVPTTNALCSDVLDRRRECWEIKMRMTIRAVPLHVFLG
jgi:hypothetical protein